MLDANADIVAMGGLFREAWKTRYAGMIEYLPATRVSGVDATAHAFIVEGIEKLRGDVLNLIPPQRAAAIAARADLLEEGGHWCPVDPRSFNPPAMRGSRHRRRRNRWCHAQVRLCRQFPGQDLRPQRRGAHGRQAAP